MNGGALNTAATSTDMYESNQHLGIGGDGTSPAEPWNGRISQAYYFNAALSDAEISSIAGAAHPIRFDDLDTDLRDDGRLESCWALDEPSCAMARDLMGNNNLDWGFWWLGCAPGQETAGFPGLEFVSTSNNVLKASSTLAGQFSGVNMPLTMLVLSRTNDPNVYGSSDAYLGLGLSTDSVPYRCWHTRAAYQQYAQGVDGNASLYLGYVFTPIDAVDHTIGTPDTAAHVQCLTWTGPNSPSEAMLHVDDPVLPATPASSAALTQSLTFNRLSIGAIARADGSALVYPFGGHIGMVILVPAVLSQPERILAMHWLRAQAGLYV